MVEVRPVVSVIIPTCLRPDLLKGAVSSVLSQGFRDLELIVVDDDPAMSGRLSVLACQDPRVSYLAHAQRKGGSAARNTGLAQAKGRFVAFLDDDDLWHEDLLEHMVAAMNAAPKEVGVVSCTVDFINALGERRRSRTWASARGDVFSAMLRGERSIVGTVALVRREVFDICGGFDERLPSAQDWDMWIRVAKQFKFEHLSQALADVRDHGARISSDPLSPILSRALILEKYADDFKQDPQARAILLKRLAKLNAILGRWGAALGWLRQAAVGRPIEWLKALAWLILERPFAVAPGQDPRVPFYLSAVLGLSVVVTAYAQMAALRSVYVVNDDVCQHIWWMRLWRTPGLFQDDLLAEYARSLQHFGILIFYRLAAFCSDPLTVARYLPFVLFPLSSWALFRWVMVWTREPFTAFLTATAFMVTPVYMQHVVGGHAHTFGYPLLFVFLYAFSAQRYRLAAWSMIAGALLFPVVFLLTGAYWTYSFCRRTEKGLVWQGPAQGERLLGVAWLGGIAILLVKFVGMAQPLIGNVLSLEALSRMPEVTSVGRWQVWPVTPVGGALVEFMEKGLFIYKAGYRTLIPDAWKAFWLQGHMLWFGLTLVSGVWWWQKRRVVSFAPIGVLLTVSVLFYVLAAMVLLKLYAPDRYVAYTVTLIGLVGVMVPAGMTLAFWPQAFVRRVMKAAAVVVVLAWVPLTRGAGLHDYGVHKELYQFLRTLPVDAVVAAFPDTADGIPLFAQRSVLVNAELSVPLYDRYWAEVAERTRALLEAYYAPDPLPVARLRWKYNVSYLVVERHRFSAEYLNGRIYFEPFGAWAKARFRPGERFWLADMKDKDCVFQDKDVCVIDLSSVEAGRSRADGE